MYYFTAVGLGGPVTLQGAEILLKDEIVLGRIWLEKWDFSLPYQ